jgi:hypothetical protein
MLLTTAFTVLAAALGVTASPAYGVITVVRLPVSRPASCTECKPN